jgi:hypothetical protein
LPDEVKQALDLVDDIDALWARDQFGLQSLRVGP